MLSAGNIADKVINIGNANNHHNNFWELKQPHKIQSESEFVYF